MKSPILFIGFNRPELAERVFETIRTYKPHQLFIAVDGPRADVTTDADKVEAMRALAKRVDWDCELHTLFQVENKGCQYAVTKAINWFFEHVERGIILEDDCVPDPSFFTFCDEMLERYDGDERVMSISGECYPGDWIDECGASYSFSSYALIWGWATWRRAWRLYDGDMPTWQRDVETGWIDRHFSREIIRDFWLTKLWLTFNCPGFTWDYQWVYACWINSGFCLMPTRNLVSNIGCGVDATHTCNANWVMANRKREAIGFPLTHPSTVKRNYLLDETIENTRLEVAWLAPEIPVEVVDVIVEQRSMFSRVRRMASRLKSLPMRLLRRASPGENRSNDE